MATVDALAEAWAPIEARIRALDIALWERATALSGLGPGRNVWHNAMIDREAGRPWSDVDYGNLRQAIRIDEIQRRELWALESRLWRRLYQRHYPDRA